MTRSEITALLKDATLSYWAHKRYSCFNEIAVNRWGKLRADVLAVSMKGEVVLSEVKSSRADYLGDTKWREYTKYCDRMYFVLLPKTFHSLKVQLLKDLKGSGVGVMVLDPTTGYLSNVISAKRQTLEEDIRWSLVIRMAWRSGISRRTRSRRIRHFLPTKE